MDDDCRVSETLDPLSYGIASSVEDMYKFGPIFHPETRNDDKRCEKGQKLKQLYKVPPEDAGRDFDSVVALIDKKPALRKEEGV